MPSRQPVREALQRLDTEGWFDLRPAQDAFVHQPIEEEADQPLSVRTLLEAEAARLAAANSGSAGIAARPPDSETAYRNASACAAAHSRKVRGARPVTSSTVSTTPDSSSVPST